MKSLIVHLSDTHFSPKRVLSIPQTNALVAAICSVDPHATHLALVWTGDIAATGAKKEYEVATEFLTEFKAGLARANRFSKVDFFSIPGNHDITATVLGDAAATLANDVLQNEKQPKDHESTYLLLLGQQANYWDFDEAMSGSGVSKLEEKLFRVCTVQVGQYRIRLNLFNTAMLSLRNETQGKLWFPLCVTENVRGDLSPSDLEVGIFHHPYVWLESNNAVRFRQFVESHSDLVLTGHQHIAESYFANSLEGGATWYSAGSALMEPNTDESGFAVFLFDFEQKMRRLVHFKWNGNVYAVASDTQSRPFAANTGARRGYVVSETFADFLGDPESLIVHTQKKQILLQDVYEAPRLRGGLIKAGSPSRIVASEKICDALGDNEATFIFGETLSGKTWLGKELFRQMFRGDGSCVPVFLSARDLKSAKKQDVDNWVRRAYRAQYSSPPIAEFSTLAKNQRAAVVDDWHVIATSDATKKAIAKELCSTHRHVILLCDSWYQMQEISSSIEDQEALLPKNHYSILPLTPYQRSNMIKRWIDIGRNDQTSDENVIFELDAAERHLDELSRNRLMPPYPLYILSALQTMQAVRQSEPDLGAQGILFDLLVGDKLASVSEDAPELDINRQFIAFMAFTIFESEATGISEERTRELEAMFFERYAVNVKLEALLSTLVTHKILYRSDGFIRFRHRYMYYYFVAEHLSMEMSKRSAKAVAMIRLKEMAALVAFEEYAQILMFVIYKTRDQDLIDELILNSQRMFHDFPLSDLETDVAFINRFEIRRAEMALPAKTVAENRDDRRRSLQEDDAGEPDLRVQYSDDLDWAAKLQYSFKTIQMLGRVLRNFPGSLEAPVKRELAVGAYSVGLRMLRALMVESERNLADWREHLSAVEEGEEGSTTLTERIAQADALLTMLLTVCSFVIVKTVSSSVGSPKLEETYRQVNTSLGDSPAMSLVDISIKLDFFKGIPLDVLFELEETLRGNYAAHQVLRMLVWQRIVYLPVQDRVLRDQVCARFNISTGKNPALIANLPHQS